MAINQTQPANQKPTGNLYMNSSGQSMPTAPTTSSAIQTQAPAKNTWDALIAPADMPGYAGTKRRVANPDYIVGSINPANAPQVDATIPQTKPQTNTGQPSPTNVNANPYTGSSIVDSLNSQGQPSDFASRSKLAASMGIQNYTGTAQQNTQMLSQQGLAAAKASGQQPPQNGGQARTAVAGFIPQDESDTTSTLTPIVDTDKNFDNIFLQFDDFFSPPKQKQSLLQEYQSMESALGINAMNAELLNTKRIIEGTEDDIRSEVQAVSGFATDSQVLALSNARNKSLVKNYNYLLEARTSAQTQLSTMMNLSIQDRQMAGQEFDRKMNFAFKVAEFKQKATDNAKEGYNNVINAVGYDGLYKSLQQDPKSIPVVEKTLGLASGQLSNLASQRNLDRELKIAQINSANRSNQKTAGDSAPKVTSVNGVDSTWNPTTKTFEPINLGTSSKNTMQSAQSEGNISEIDKLVKDSSIRSAVGPNKIARFIGRGFDSATGTRQNYIAGVEQLRSQLTLDSLINAKARGATFGALSEGELGVLSKSASKLGTWAITDKSGKVTGYNASEKAFRSELDKINNYAKLDYILKGGDPVSVGVQKMPDGSFIVQNSDGSYTELK